MKNCLWRDNASLKKYSVSGVSGGRLCGQSGSHIIFHFGGGGGGGDKKIK